MKKHAARLQENTLFLAVVLTAAFILNFVWEHAHSALYVHYKGGEITNAILLKAAVNDALFIGAIAVLAFLFPRRYRLLFVAFAGFVLALGLEWWALETGRWAYGNAMPVVPFLETGLTPTVQLAFLGVASFLTGRTIAEKSVR